MDNIKLINFSDTTLKEKKLILEFRNDANIRKWMVNTQPISYENHLDYIKSLSSKNDVIYFLVKELDRYIGVINFTNIINKQSAELGIYSNPNIKGKGTILLTSIINYGFSKFFLQKIIAQVLIDNQRAISLYNKFNFIEYKRDSQFIYMELTNENWKF